MRIAPILVTATLAAFAGPAFAQSQASQSETPHTGPGAQIRHDLEQAGFTDIKVLPQSFLIQAKNREGQPVTMFISPGGVTAVTEEGQPHMATDRQAGSEPQPAGAGHDMATGSAEMQGTNTPSPVGASGGTTPSPHVGASSGAPAQGQ